MIAELYTGRVLLPGNSELEQFMLIVELLGVPPSRIFALSSKSYLFFEKDGSLKPLIFEDQRELIPLSKKLEWEDSKILDFVLKCLT